MEKTRVFRVSGPHYRALAEMAEAEQRDLPRMLRRVIEEAFARRTGVEGELLDLHALLAASRAGHRAANA